MGLSMLTLVVATQLEGYHLVETVEVSATGSTARSVHALEQGVTFKLRSASTTTIGGPSNGQGDAEFQGFDPRYDFCFPEHGGNDIGIAVDQTAPSQDKLPRWGEYSPDHAYVAEYVGTGQRLTLMFNDCWYGDNSGSFLVEIFAPDVASEISDAAQPPQPMPDASSSQEASRAQPDWNGGTVIAMVDCSCVTSTGSPDVPAGWGLVLLALMRCRPAASVSTRPPRDRGSV